MHLGVINMSFQHWRLILFDWVDPNTMNELMINQSHVWLNTSILEIQIRVEFVHLFFVCLCKISRRENPIRYAHIFLIQYVKKDNTMCDKQYFFSLSIYLFIFSIWLPLLNIYIQNNYYFLYQLDTLGQLIN